MGTGRKGAEIYYREIIDYRKNGEIETADKIELEFRRLTETGGFFESEKADYFIAALAEDKRGIIKKQANDRLLERLSIVNSSEFREFERQQRAIDDSRRSVKFWADRLKSEGKTPILTYSQKAVNDKLDLDGMAEYLHGKLSADQRELIVEGIQEGLQGVSDKGYIASREYSIGMSKAEMVAFGANLATTYGKSKAEYAIKRLSDLQSDELDTKEILKLNNFG